MPIADFHRIHKIVYTHLTLSHDEIVFPPNLKKSMTQWNRNIFANSVYLFGGIAALYVGDCGAESQVTDSVAPRIEAELSAITSAVVGEALVTGIPNKFILLRKGDHVCAVKFNTFRRDYDAKPATRTSTGEENTYASYEWFYQKDGSSDFKKSNVAFGNGNLHRGPATGILFDITIWRSFDKRWIECGPFNPTWIYPTTITFTSYKGSSLKRDYELEIAATNWSQVEEIDIASPKLFWAKLNSGTVHRPSIYIPLQDLP